MSPSINEIFAADARKFTSRLRDALDVGGQPDLDALRRAARRLQHVAVLAAHEPVIHAAAAVQRSVIQVMAGKRVWTGELFAAIRTTLDRLDDVIAALPGRDEAADSTLRQAADAMLLPATPARPGTPAPVSDAAQGVAPAAPAVDEPTPNAEEPAAVEQEPVPVAEVEAEGAPGKDEADALLDALIEDLGSAVERLENDPRDREPLKTMLRKIRRLRELKRIGEDSPENKALSAVEELILQIADLNATVGPGYLTVFRHTRELLEGMRERGEGALEEQEVGGRVVEVDQLKASVMEKVRRARQVIWVSELFYPQGPHIIDCPRALQQAGSSESYFLNEARERLDRSEKLRQTMLESDTEQMRLAGESLALTLRHLRERAAAFNHPGLGRVTRRAAAALRAQLVRPPSRLREMASGFGDLFAALARYLESDDAAIRSQAVTDADEALQFSVLGGEPAAPEQEAPGFDPDTALQQALALRTRIDNRLQGLRGPEAEALRQDLEELFDLIAVYVSASAERH